MGTKPAKARGDWDLGVLTPCPWTLVSASFPLCRTGVQWGHRQNGRIGSGWVCTPSWHVSLSPMGISSKYSSYVEHLCEPAPQEWCVVTEKIWVLLIFNPELKVISQSF